jgi:histidinol-phosphate phosphatase family protein
MRASLTELEQKHCRRNEGQRAFRPAVLIDRDGTINEELGYLRDPDKVALLPTAGKAVAMLNKQGLPLIVITNQSALNRGIMEWTDFESVNEALWEALQEKGARYDGLYYCPHNPDDDPPCDCRKPRPGLLLQAAFDFDLDLHHCFFIGDKRSDLEAARQCECRTILVRTGWGEEAIQEIIAQRYEPDYVATTLLEAANWIIRQIRTEGSVAS